MASSRREREMARLRLERQAARRAAMRARRRQRIAIISSAVAVLLVLGGSLYLTQRLGGDDPAAKAAAKSSASPTPSATPSTSASPGAPPTVACGAQAPPAALPQTFPAEPPLTIDQKATYATTLETSCGAITFTMDAAKAPHTVNSFAFLADKHFYDGTFCHRETATPSLTVLQCGDPKGDGTGGPGYTIEEENLAGAKYSRGVVAMAKTQAPHSTGSQFFLIDKDSELPPQYTVVGRITQGLDVLDKITAIGQDDSNGQGDGAPKQRVYLDRVTVRKV